MSGVDRKKIGIVVAILVVLFVLSQPDKSSDLVRNGFSGLGDAWDNLMQFINGLA